MSSNIHPNLSDLSIETATEKAFPDTYLMTDPEYFDVNYTINPHMGGEVDIGLARTQWETLKQEFETYGRTIQVAQMSDDLSPNPNDLPDFVFCANHAVIHPDKKKALLAQFKHPERSGEVEHIERWFNARGYTTERMNPAIPYEAMGDCLGHPGGDFLWAGYGIRTQYEALQQVSDFVDKPVIPLELESETYYHLDTCFSPLDSRTVLIAPSAFSSEALSRINTVWETVLTAPAPESKGGFACNARSLDGTHVVLSSGNTQTNRLLTDAGFVPVPVDTSEFQKAGGSVACLNLPLQ